MAIDRLLWKMGFRPDEYDDWVSRLSAQIKIFNNKLFSLSAIQSDADREAIRSSGVNLFVYLEDYLESLISNNVWILSNDIF
jgi:hypothetical protein